MFASLMRKRISPSPAFSATLRSMITSAQSLPSVALISESRFPSNCLYSGRLKPITITFGGVAISQRFSYPASVACISATIVARRAGSRRFSRSLPSAAYLGGMQLAKELPPAG